MYVIYLEWTIGTTSTNHTAALDRTLTIGRDTANTFVVTDTRVSRRQATLSAKAGGVRIANVSTTNAIKVGGQVVEIDSSTDLADKATIQMGDTNLFTRIVEMADGSALDASCTNCAKPIPSGTQVCPWCGATQQSTDAGYTMA